MIKRSIYVHIPFCKHKCSYCSFYSINFDESVAEQYISSMINEINEKQALLRDTECTSVYIGGGTPSVLSGGQIVRIVNEIKKWCNIDGVEFTIEVNPESLTEEKLLTYEAIGINRISIGMQSSNNKVLKASGRIHTNEQFLDAIKLIKKHKFKNFNIDCILGLPKSTKTTIDESLKQAIRLRPKHISCYALQCEEGTKLYSDVREGKFKLLEDNKFAKLLKNAYEQLKSSNYIHYEISNFAKRGYESKHNLNYWQGGEYIGFGAGAVSFYEDKRILNNSTVNNYCKGEYTHEVDFLTEKEKTEEAIMLGLRTNKGVDMKYINKNKTKFIKQLINGEFAVIKKNRLILTSEGLLISNDIISSLF